MQNGQIIGLHFYDISRQEQEILINSFVSGLLSESIPDFVAANKTKALIPCSTSRQPRENIYLRYGKQFKFGDITVFDKDTFEYFGADIKKITSHESYKEKSWLFFYDDIINDDSVKLFDSINLVLKPTQSAIPAAYQYIKAMKKNGCTMPLGIITYGERLIEKAAEFFLGLKTDVKKLAGERLLIHFAGFIYLPPEEKDLLLMFNTDVPRAFPKGNVHGQIAYCLRRITEHNDTIASEPQAERLLALSG